MKATWIKLMTVGLVFAAAAIMLCVTLPERTVIEELVVSPTRTRDQSRDIEVARNLGAPPGVK